MPHNYLIRKSSGSDQHYSVDKLRNSLRLSGASAEMVESIVNEIEKDLPEGISSKGIFKKAFRMLRMKQHSLAARYSLKNAIMELGPTGYPFEKFIGEIFKALGFGVKTGTFAEGRCVTHEIDVIATGQNVNIMVECKYHNTPGKMSNVQVPLYIHSRFQDIREKMRGDTSGEMKSFEGWVITNTRFSEDAEKYGKCVGLHLVSWDYPRNGSLKDMVENTGLFPVTVLTCINKFQKQQLVERNIVLCRDILNNPSAIGFLGLSNSLNNKILTEVRELCSWF